jgi:hypothetical protein
MLLKQNSTIFVGLKCCKFTLYVKGTNSNISFGLQERTLLGDIPVFCIPSGSTKGPQLSFSDKLEHYKQFASYIHSL